MSSAQQLAEFAAAYRPMSDHLKALASERQLPRADVAMCVARIEEAAPALCELLQRASLGFDLDEDEATLLFRGLHVLGAARYEGAFRSLLCFLVRPGDEVDAILGDAITEGLSQIVAGMFDGDADALFAAICDLRADQFVRDAMLGAATFLAWEGRIERDRMRQFLERFFEHRRAPPGDHAWCGWQEAIALLGMRELTPMVETAFAQALVDPMTTTLDYFLDDLSRAERDPSDMARFKFDRLGYIDDVLEQLASWAPPNSEDGAIENDSARFEAPAPLVNAWRHVGRNDPCPCGSGRKAKKCCL